MGYRKVGAFEQCWYVIWYVVQEKARKFLKRRSGSASSKH